MNLDNWKTLAEVIRHLAEAAAILVAAGYFLYRLWRGYFIQNMAISVRCLRKTSTGTNTNEDYLAVTVNVAKRDRGSVDLQDAKVRVSWPGARPRVRPLRGVDRRSLDYIKFQGCVRKGFIFRAARGILRPLEKRLQDCVLKDVIFNEWKSV